MYRQITVYRYNIYYLNKYIIDLICIWVSRTHILIYVILLTSSMAREAGRSEHKVMLKPNPVVLDDA